MSKLTVGAISGCLKVSSALYEVNLENSFKSLAENSFFSNSIDSYDNYSAVSILSLSFCSLVSFIFFGGLISSASSYSADLATAWRRSLFYPKLICLVYKLI